MNDLRLALRSLRRAPAFSAVALVVLGLGIALTTTVFSVVQGTLLRPLPFPAANRLVDIASIPKKYWRPGGGGMTSPLSAFDAWRNERGVIEEAAGYTSGGRPVFPGSGGPVRLEAWAVTAGLFSLFGGSPGLSRSFLPEARDPAPASRSPA